jgi:hypothetical protein
MLRKGEEIRMKLFEEPKYDVISFDATDIVTASLDQGEMPEDPTCVVD